MKRSAALLLSLLITGCVSTPSSIPPASDAEAAQLNLKLGIGYMEQGHYSVALEKLQRALAYNPRLAEAENALGVLYEQTDQSELAERHYRKALQLQPGYLLAEMNLARVLCANGRTDEGQHLFLQVAADPRTTAPEIAYTGAGVCARLAGHQTAAERLFKEALNKNPQAASPLFELARLSYQQGHYQEAESYLLQYHKRTPFSPASLKLAVDIETALGNTRMRDAYSRLLHERFPNSAEARQLVSVQ